MRGSKWAFLLSLVLVLGVFLSACSGGGSDKSSGNSGDQDKGKDSGGDSQGKLASDQVFNVNIKEEPPSLHPGKATDTTSGAVLTQTFEGLTRLNPDGDAEKAMASDIDVSDDKKTYTFTIRDDAKWSNGDDVTADDFAYAWKWVLNPDSPDTDYAYQLYPIKNAEKANEGDVDLDKVGIDVKDDQTLKVTLENPTPYFLELTAFYTFLPVDKDAVKGDKKGKWAEDAGDEYVTNGPFKMESWKHKDQIVLKKNEDYWDADSVNLETINMYMVDDEATELKMYKNDKLDWAGDPTGSIPLSAIPKLKDDGDLKIEPKTGVYYVSFNTKKKPFTNKNIRKALAFAINRKGIVENITKGEEKPAEALVPISLWKENEEGYFKDNDVDKAKEYLQKGLDELGLDSADDLPTIQYSYNTDEGHAAIGQAVQDMWKKNLGLNVKLDNSEWKVYLDKLSNGNYQSGRMGWIADFNDPVNFLEIFRTVGGNNYTNWEDDEFKDLIDQAKAEKDTDKRKGELRDAEKIFMDDMPIAPVYFYSNVYMHKDYVKGISVNSLGNMQMKWGKITEH